MTQLYPKRLIEVDLPIKRISTHARREKNLRQGHISTLHMWWARRPLAACRAVICAALWPDPVDDLCPQSFRDAATRSLNNFAKKAMGDKKLGETASETSMGRWNALSKQPLEDENPEHWNILRYALLDFIADFSNWDNSNNRTYLETSRTLTQAAHEALGGLPETRPLVVDPFAGGGAIPMEALRVGADAFASDLNPVAVLLNKVVLEYIPQYGQELAEEVRKWGQQVKEQAEKELTEFYPKDSDGATPIAYLWARTLDCPGPTCGVQIPLMNQLWISKRKGISLVFTNVVDKKVKYEIRKLRNKEEPQRGTVRNGTITCPSCGFTLSAKQYRKTALSGNLSEELYAVVLRNEDGSRKYRVPTENDRVAFEKAAKLSDHYETTSRNGLSLIPNEPLSEDEPRRLNVRLYGFFNWNQLFNKRQKVALVKYSEILKKLHIKILENTNDSEFAAAITTILALSISNIVHYNSNMSTYLSDGMISAFIQGSAIPMRADYAEVNPLIENLVGGYNYQLKRTLTSIENNLEADFQVPGSVIKSTATQSYLPDNSVDSLITDPPYYFAIPYADLSDFFYVWLRRFLIDVFPSLFLEDVTPKAEEAIQNLPHSQSPSQKDKAHFEKQIRLSLQEYLRVLKPTGIAVIVFANATTEGWEALLRALIEANWVVTGSWPIETERSSRMLANRQSTLASSIHLVCRTRETKDIGDWRDVLQELPRRIHAWLPRLAKEGVVGADAIFACLGPALEIFSRFARVEKASGEIITLGEYLEYVWGAVSREALNMVFAGADTTGFEEDARLTAMWLWTLSTDEDDNDSSKIVSSPGYTLEYDAARKIAQGLGAHLEQLDHLVKISGSNARLLPVSERTDYLFGNGGLQTGSHKRKPEPGARQLSLLDQLSEEAAAEWQLSEETIIQNGKTMLDRVHQAMLLFAAGRSDALKSFLVTAGVGQDEGFWRLANALSALYPAITDEKRWVDGVLARKKGLGF